MALGELEEPSRRPCLILVAGLPGTGKSSLARELAAAGNFRVIRSDVVRKELASRGTTEATIERLSESFYTPEWNSRTYARCWRRAEELLFEGERVLVDANFREERERRAFLRMAEARGVVGCLLVCTARPETVRRRLQERSADASDADWAVYERVAPRWEAMGKATLRTMREVSTDGSLAEARGQATSALRELGLW